MTTTDPEFIELFRDEASKCLRDMRNALRLLYQDPANTKAIELGQRGAHTIKGSAGLLGLRRISALAKEIEDGLRDASTGHTSLSLQNVVYYAQLTEEIKSQVP